MNNLPQRKSSPRLSHFDYSNPGAYFVTIAAHQHLCIFGQVDEGDMILNDLGRVVQEHWLRITYYFPEVILDEFIIMPNHFHGIIFIEEIEPHQKNLSRVIQMFKTWSARKINIIRGSRGNPVWQRSFFDRVIRDEKEYLSIREYIISNPHNWDQKKMDYMDW